MSEVLLSVRDRIGYLSFNRPEARNAVYPGMLDELIAALQRFETDPQIRVIVLGGTGGAFCAGADRKKFLVQLPAKSAQEIQQDIYERFLGTARRLKLSSKPTIAAVQGARHRCRLRVCTRVRVSDCRRRCAVLRELG